MLLHLIIMVGYRYRANEADTLPIQRPDHQYFAAALILPNAYTLALKITPFPMTAGDTVSVNAILFSASFVLPFVAMTLHWLAHQLTKIA